MKLLLVESEIAFHLIPDDEREEQLIQRILGGGFTLGTSTSPPENMPHSLAKWYRGVGVIKFTMQKPNTHEINKPTKENDTMAINQPSLRERLDQLIFQSMRYASTRENDIGDHKKLEDLRDRIVAFYDNAQSCAPLAPKSQATGGPRQPETLADLLKDDREFRRLQAEGHAQKFHQDRRREIAMKILEKWLPNHSPVLLDERNINKFAANIFLLADAMLDQSKGGQPDASPDAP